MEATPVLDRGAGAGAGAGAGQELPHHLWWVASPVVFPALTVAYVVLALGGGERLMRGRKPMSLRPLLLVYNAMQVALNAALLVRALRLLLSPRFDPLCQSALAEPADSFHVEAMAVTYDYFLLKVLDLADTAFFVLRGKTSHVTFLHVYHHSSMVIFSWMLVRIVPGGGIIMAEGAANMFIHVVMYSYYLLTALQVAVPPQLKKMITRMQMLQFVAALLHLGHGAARCPSSVGSGFALPCVAQSGVFLTLFWDFYRRAYRPKSA